MVAALPTPLVEVGAWAALVVAVLAALAAVMRLRPVRWLWVQLVTEPVSEAFVAQVRREVQAATAELRTNGGGSIKDQVSEVAGEVRLMRTQLDAGHKHLALHDHLLADHGSQIAHHAQTIAAIKADTPKEEEQHHDR